MADIFLTSDEHFAGHVISRRQDPSCRCQWQRKISTAPSLPCQRRIRREHDYWRRSERLPEAARKNGRRQRKQRHRRWQRQQEPVGKFHLRLPKKFQSEVLQDRQNDRCRPDNLDSFG